MSNAKLFNNQIITDITGMATNVSMSMYIEGMSSFSAQTMV